MQAQQIIKYTTNTGLSSNKKVNLLPKTQHTGELGQEIPFPWLEVSLEVGQMQYNSIQLSPFSPSSIPSSNFPQYFPFRKNKFLMRTRISPNG